MTIRFDRFEFDDTSGELRDGATVTRLAPQVAAVLALLLANADSVVTRDRFKEELWPDTTVEFDDGLNFCIRQLRVALGDDASSPRFVETLPRRGYRFIAPVLGDREVRVDSAPSSSSRRWRAAVVGTLFAGAAVAALISWRGVLGVPPRVVLAVLPFDVDMADSAAARYQKGLAEGLVVTLTNAAGARASVVGPLSTARFGGMRTPVDSLGEVLGATHVLSGAISRDSNGLRVFAQLIRVSDRRHLFAARLPGARVDSVANGVLQTLGLRLKGH
ncbi:MAG: winged helix-turn-helix domain-containing protein [Gemmatimonadota bacterium]